MRAREFFAEFLREVNELASNIIHMKEPEYREGPEALEGFKGTSDRDSTGSQGRDKAQRSK
jgi:hypothetical protein